MDRSHLSRRGLLAATAAVAATAGRAQDPQTPQTGARGFEVQAEAYADRLHAIVVRQGGVEVFARRWGGPGLDAIANVKSVSKTILALMTGVAIEREIIPGVDAPVLELLGRDPAGDARDALTVGHLLTMRTGLQSVSGPRYGAWVSSGNWVSEVLDAPLVAEPGGRYIYSTGGWHVLGAALSQATGDSLLTLARSWLGAPLGVDFAPWVRDPQGRYLGGNDMGVSPRGLARIGQMVLDGGVWDGSQVVPQAWIEASWERRARSPFSGDGYGYGWFLTRLDGAFAAYGRGYGGQMLAVVPEREVVIAITSDPTRPARSRGYFAALRDLADAIVREV